MRTPTAVAKQRRSPLTTPTNSTNCLSDATKTALSGDRAQEEQTRAQIQQLEERLGGPYPEKKNLTRSITKGILCGAESAMGSACSATPSGDTRGRGRLMRDRQRHAGTACRCVHDTLAGLDGARLPGAARRRERKAKVMSSSWPAWRPATGASRWTPTPARTSGCCWEGCAPGPACRKPALTEPRASTWRLPS